MSLTGHFINKNWELMDITLGIAEIEGEVFYTYSKHLSFTDTIFEVHMIPRAVLALCYCVWTSIMSQTSRTQ